LKGRWADTFTTSSAGDGFVFWGGAQQQFLEMWILLEKHGIDHGVRCYLLLVVE